VQLIALAPLSLDEVSLRGSLFASDSRYGAFLESVARAVPENAVVAVVAPKRSDFEWYTAHYALAPRRVVPPDRLRSADFVAVFDPGSVPHPGESWPVEFGSLRRLR